jgi:Ca-activated chloride channel family protein
LETAIKNLTTARRTAIGEGIIVSLDAIAEFDDSVPSPYSDAELVPLPQGEYVPAIIVLLTDGVNTTGVHPLLAGQLSADRGIRVYTIGFGTDHNNTIPNCGGFASQGSPDQFGGSFGGGGGGFRREIDEETLKQVSELTGGTYHLAASASELEEVFKNLPTRLMTITETTEVSVIFTAIGALFASLAVLFAILWHPLP